MCRCTLKHRHSGSQALKEFEGFLFEIFFEVVVLVEKAKEGWFSMCGVSVIMSLGGSLVALNGDEKIRQRSRNYHNQMMTDSLA